MTAPVKLPVVKQLPISSDAVERLENRKQRSWLNLGMASIAVAVTAGLNIAGGALLGFDLAQGSMVATIAGGIIGAVFEVGIVHGYLNGTRKRSLAIVHAASAGALILGMMHMASMSVSQSVATRQDKAVAVAEIQEAEAKLQQLAVYKNKVSDKEVALLSIKNKSVKGGLLWSVSEGCTNNKHPKDCATLAIIEHDLASLYEQKPNISQQQLEQRISELRAKFPESRLNQGMVEETGIDKSIFEKLRDAIAPSMSINLLLLITCGLIALVLQQILANVLSPFGIYKKVQKPESSGIKAESSEVENLNQGILKNFFSVGSLAQKLADSYGRRKAELEYKAQRESEREADISNRAVWDVTTSLKTISPNNAAILLEKNNLLAGLKEEKKAQLLKSMIWVIRKYEAGEDVKLRELAAEITLETNANFINYSFIQRTVQPAMIAIGLWVNQGTEHRAKIVWASEENAVKAMRK